MKEVIYEIIENAEIAPAVFEMRLRGDVSAFFKAGQFIDIRIPGKYLRRPISVCDYDDGGLTIVYKVVGEGTRALSEMKAGGKINALAGLGNGFDEFVSAENIALIGGADVGAKIRLDSEPQKIRLCFDRRLLRVIELPRIAFHSAAIFFRKLSCIGGCDFFIGKQCLTQLLRQICIRRKRILRHADKYFRIRIGNSKVPRFSMIELVLRDMEQHRFWMLF